MGRAAIERTAWIVFAVTVVLHLTGLYTSHAHLAHATKPFAMAALLLAFAMRVRAWRAPMILTALGLGFSWIGDTLPAVLPGDPQVSAALLFLVALIAYCAALLPMWLRSWDSLRVLLAIPYAGVVVGLFVACADGAGGMLPPMVLYAVALATMAFLASGVNGLTWIGGTLFLASSSVLAMTWFLPGAWVPHAAFWVMISYFAAQLFLVLGILQVRMQPRRLHGAPEVGAGATTLLIVEG